MLTMLANIALRQRLRSLPIDSPSPEAASQRLIFVPVLKSISVSSVLASGVILDRKGAS
jgi:hypothetical protein